MGTFSTSMRQTVALLLEELGDPCTITYIVKGAYNPAVGKSPESKQTFNSFSGLSKDINLTFGQDGQNTNLVGMGSQKVIIPWFDQPKFNESWLYNGSNIVKVSKLSTQGEIVAYELEIAE